MAHRKQTKRPYSAERSQNWSKLLMEASMGWFPYREDDEGMRPGRGPYGSAAHGRRGEEELLPPIQGGLAGLYQCGMRPGGVACADGGEDPTNAAGSQAGDCGKQPPRLEKGTGKTEPSSLLEGSGIQGRNGGGGRGERRRRRKGKARNKQTDKNKRKLEGCAGKEARREEWTRLLMNRSGRGQAVGSRHCRRLWEE